jgi:hypothetical protein
LYSARHDPPDTRAGNALDGGRDALDLDPGRDIGAERGDDGIEEGMVASGDPANPGLLVQVTTRVSHQVPPDLHEIGLERPDDRDVVHRDQDAPTMSRP